MRELLVLVLLGFCLLGWWHWRGIKDLALQEARRRCRQLELQLLDETVQLASVRLAKGDRGERVLLRRYRFEFTCTGGERLSGSIGLRGRSVEDLALPVHLMPATGEEIPPADRLH